MPSFDTIPLPAWPFDLASTLTGGQAFHWHAHRDGWAGLIGEVPVWIGQFTASHLQCSQGHSNLVAHYLGLDHDLTAITAGFPRDDEPLQRAIAWCPGLRLIRQPGWECLATFITSSQKQVPHIRRISLTLRERFGRRVKAPGLPDQWSYPAPGALAQAGEAALRACGLGYRAAFLHRTAGDIDAGRFDLAGISTLPDDAAREALCQLHGVGEKIANCALLYGWQRLAAFPVDVWVERILRQLYFAGNPDINAKNLRDFARDHFGPSGGYAQQFLFHYARLSGALNLKKADDVEQKGAKIRK